ncbi:MAG: tetratricopeptide repeat protein [Desulfobacterales bacterium]
MMLCFSCSGLKTTLKDNEAYRIGMSEITTGSLLYRKGCYTQSLNHFFKAFEIFAVSDNVEGTALCLNNIGNVYKAFGDTKSALLFYDESCSIYLVLEDYKGAVHALSNKAAALIYKGELEEADNVLAAAENIAETNHIEFNPLLTNRGILLTKKKEFHKAEKLLRISLKKTDKKDLSSFAAVNFALGDLMVKTGRFDEAVVLFNRSLSSDRQACFYVGIADDLSSIGDSLLSLGKNKEAVFYYKRSIMSYSLTDNREKADIILKKLENAADKTGEDISLTRFFINRWRERINLNAFCE